MTAGIINQINAGAGDDIVTSRADRTTPRRWRLGRRHDFRLRPDIGAVAGGSGDDNIIAYGDIVGSVSGGDGDDQIVVARAMSPSPKAAQAVHSPS